MVQYCMKQHKFKLPIRDIFFIFSFNQKRLSYNWNFILKYWLKEFSQLKLLSFDFIIYDKIWKDQGYFIVSLI